VNTLTKKINLQLGTNGGLQLNICGVILARFIMALLDPKLYSKNVLVVGDDNFLFTLCLASALSKPLVKITRRLVEQ